VNTRVNILFGSLETVKKGNRRSRDGQDSSSILHSATASDLSLLVRTTGWFGRVYSHYDLFLFVGFSLLSSADEAVIVLSVNAPHNFALIIWFVVHPTIFVLSFGGHACAKMRAMVTHTLNVFTLRCSLIRRAYKV